MDLKYLRLHKNKEYIPVESSTRTEGDRKVFQAHLYLAYFSWNMYNYAMYMNLYQWAQHHLLICVLILNNHWWTMTAKIKIRKKTRVGFGFAKTMIYSFFVNGNLTHWLQQMDLEEHKGLRYNKGVTCHRFPWQQNIYFQHFRETQTSSIVRIRF